MHHLVNEDTLAKIARDTALNEHIRLSNNEEKTGGRDKVQSYLMRWRHLLLRYFWIAITMCIYFISMHWANYLNYNEPLPIDPKTELQEWCHSRGIGLPVYVEAEKLGPDPVRNLRSMSF